MILALFLLAIDPRYHTYAALVHELDSIARQNPTIVHLDTLGWSTRDSLIIPAVKISDHADQEEDEPAILFIGGHHAEEVLGTEICLYMIRDLVTRYNQDSARTHWINNREIWFVPLLNPEGHEVVLTDLDTIWRKDKRDNNDNGIFDLDYDGVDLNRNYDFHWSGGGTMDPTSENYRGPYPFSENETRAIRDLARAHKFVFAISYHSPRTGIGEVVYYPWRDPSGYPPDILFIRQVVDSVAKSIVNDNGNGRYSPMIGDTLDGMCRNWLYGVCGTFAYEIEVSHACQPPGGKVDSICIRNLPGAYYLLSRSGATGITGHVIDTLTGQPVSAEVIVDGYYDPDLPVRKSDPRFGRFLRIVTAGTYDLTVRKWGYAPKSVAGVKVAPGAMTDVEVYLNPMEHETGGISNPGIIVLPNPAGKFIVFKLDLSSEFMSLNIYDIDGRLIKTLNTSDRRLALTNAFTWNTLDDLGRRVPNGVYIVIGKTATRRMINKFVIYE
jgi:hypothetical protein